MLPALPGTSTERQPPGRDPDDALRRDTTEKPSTIDVSLCPTRATGVKPIPRRGGGDPSLSPAPSSRSLRWHRTTLAAVELLIHGGVGMELVCVVKVSGVVAVRPEDESVDIEVDLVSSL